jgi:hypothetical protein
MATTENLERLIKDEILIVREARRQLAALPVDLRRRRRPTMPDSNANLERLLKDAILICREASRRLDAIPPRPKTEKTRGAA